LRAQGLLSETAWVRAAVSYAASAVHPSTAPAVLMSLDTWRVLPLRAARVR
jgi:hypothetical protein